MDVSKARIIFLSVVCTVGMVILVENLSPGFLRQVRFYEPEDVKAVLPVPSEKFAESLQTTNFRPILDEAQVTKKVSSVTERSLISRRNEIRKNATALPSGTSTDVSDEQQDLSTKNASSASQGNFIDVSDERENDIFYDFSTPPETTTAVRRPITEEMPATVILKQPMEHIQWNISPTNHVILFWTKFYTGDVTPDNTLYKEIMRDIKKCPYSNCVLSNDRRMLSESGALIFHVTDLQEWDLPKSRSPDQYYIYYGLESPVHLFFDFVPFSSYFNMTMTFRLDSDIVTHSYFQHFNPKVWTKSTDFENLMKKKQKLAAIFVSNCNPSGGRDVYLRDLKKLLEIDVYGKCGSLECKTENSDTCDQLVTQYKFYLAFENSVCRDYVTEKIHRAFNYGAVPVVYGGANYSAIFPPQSFINVLDYESPNKLADYLLYLDKNPKEYSKYFAWHKSPKTARLSAEIKPENLGFCKICTILNTRQPAHHEVKNLQDWWGKGWCTNPDTGPNGSDRDPHWIKNPVIPSQ